MLIFGHRGASGYEPENTGSSFNQAFKLGADGVEFDIQLSLDNIPVVMHDETLERTTNGKGYVKEKTLAQLKELDAGNGEKIPTVEEALGLINGKTLVNLELKAGRTALPIAKIIKYYVRYKGWEYADFIVSSFNHAELKLFHKTLPSVKVGVLINANLSSCFKTAEEIKAFSINIPLKLVNGKNINKIHERSFKVFVFTVNSKKKALEMEKLGVDGVFSNYPDQVR